MKVELWREVVELRAAKRFGEIESLVSGQCSASDDAALLVLAKARQSKGESRAEIDQLVDRLHGTLPLNDIVANLELSHAYSNGYGSVRFDE
jgi:hypothetical protein